MKDNIKNLSLFIDYVIRQNESQEKDFQISRIW